MTDEYEDRTLCAHCAADARRNAAAGSSNAEAEKAWGAMISEPEEEEMPDTERAPCAVRTCEGDGTHNTSYGFLCKECALAWEETAHYYNALRAMTRPAVRS